MVTKMDPVNPGVEPPHLGEPAISRPEKACTPRRLITK